MVCSGSQKLLTYGKSDMYLRGISYTLSSILKSIESLVLTVLQLKYVTNSAKASA